MSSVEITEIVKPRRGRPPKNKNAVRIESALVTPPTPPAQPEFIVEEVIDPVKQKEANDIAETEALLIEEIRGKLKMFYIQEPESFPAIKKIDAFDKMTDVKLKFEYDLYQLRQSSDFSARVSSQALSQVGVGIGAGIKYLSPLMGMEPVDIVTPLSQKLADDRNACHITSRILTKYLYGMLGDFGQLGVLITGDTLSTLAEHQGVTEEPPADVEAET